LFAITFSPRPRHADFSPPLSLFRHAADAFRFCHYYFMPFHAIDGKRQQRRMARACGASGNAGSAARQGQAARAIAQ